MAFVTVFLKTLGILVGTLTFIIFLNLIFYFTEEKNNNFSFIEGDEQSKNVIAVLNLNGPIINNFNNTLVGNVIEYIDPKIVESYLTDLKELEPKILIIKLNSPGGTVTASSYLERIINNFKKKNNNVDIYFYSSELLASGGYWVATTGDKIYASYGSIIGSIGVSGPSWYYYDKPSLISKGILGETIETRNEIKVFNQTAGIYKDLYNPFREPTQYELNHLKKIIENIYNDFLIKVSNSRKIEIESIKNNIGALIYNSNQAKNNFLIDGVYDFDELIEQININKKYADYKILELKTKDNIVNRYLNTYLKTNYKDICDKISSNFVSVLPLYLKNC